MLFFQDVKTVRENVNKKIEELRVDMAKEIAALNHNYSFPHKKVDIIADAITKLVEWYNLLLPKLDKKAKVDAHSFEKIEETLGNLKDLILKFGSSLSSTPESLSKKFMSLESTIKADMDPLLKFISLMPIDAPPVRTRV